MQKLTRKERRALRHIHAPHGTGSSRATVTTKSDQLRANLYQDFDERTRKQYRTDFAHFLNEQFDIPMQTAYGKLYYWRIEEWEAYGLVGIITQYCKENDLNPPEWPSANQATSTNEKVSSSCAAGTIPPSTWQQSIQEWLNTLPAKMKFYHFMRERGMCRTFLRRIITGQSTITLLQLVGIETAFCKWYEHLLCATQPFRMAERIMNQQNAE